MILTFHFGKMGVKGEEQGDLLPQGSIGAAVWGAWLGQGEWGGGAIMGHLEFEVPPPSFTNYTTATIKE